MSTDRVSVTRTIPAPAEKIFAVLADPWPTRRATPRSTDRAP
ncbi:hypothetical protein [Ornithinimicrobium sp. W1665]